MAFDPILSAEILSGKFAKSRLFQKIKNSLDWLYAQTGPSAGTDITNGSFEVDSDSDGRPDSWTAGTYPGGIVELSPIDASHGSKALAMIHPGGAGNGGGFASSDYVPCTPQLAEILTMVHWVSPSASGMHNQVVVSFYTSGKTPAGSDQILYDSKQNPTTERAVVMLFTPPAGARFYRVRLYGGLSDTDVAGTAYFDSVSRQVQRSAFMSQPSLAEGEIAEQFHDSGWADKGYFDLAMPIKNKDTTITFQAELKALNGVTNYQRFRIGAAYSNEGSTDLNTYQTRTYSIDLPAAETVGDLQVYQQLSGGNVYGRKLGTTVSQPAALP